MLAPCALGQAKARQKLIHNRPAFHIITRQWLPACAEREVYMNRNRPKGNRKHLTLSDRIRIEQGLGLGETFRKIAIATQKDPSTISKEVRGKAIYAERKSKENVPVPCEHNHDPGQPRRRICQIRHVCGDYDCMQPCWSCEKYTCTELCDQYVPRSCEKLKKPPYCCNGCSKRVNCLMDRKIYSSKHAQDIHDDLQRSSREGINQTPERIQVMNDIITPLVKKGQSIGHIYATHAEDLQCSRTTLYRYIDAGVFDIGNIDLRRRVRYKIRKKPTRTSTADKAYRKGRTYAEFCEWVKQNPHGSIVEMDTVEGKKDSRPCLMTMLFRNCNLMLIFLLRSQTQGEVERIFDWLTDVLGIGLFQKLFEVILTDNGAEFQNPEKLECDRWGEIRTRIYYCDPYRSNQKGALEKNHEYIRYVLPKGTSFVGMTEEKAVLLMNHINSEKRDSLNGHSPFEVSRLLLDNRLHTALGLKEIPADEVMLKPALVK